MGKLSTLVVILILLGAGAWYLNYHLKLSEYDKELMFNKEKTVQGVTYYTSPVIPAGIYRIKIEPSGSVDNVRIISEAGKVLHESLIVVKSDFIYTSDVPFKVEVEFHPEEGYNKYSISLRIYRLVKK
ncbi:hypothetical protein [Thermococcus paralvinellae]|uniref:Uncharacterized protein n=1 Tax=Thermococcus paralvinellae TaxID=582419 RepID=W0I8Q0_9EURY|nr:hypothetical protein [Thermococcus paralvinellae]AHF80808.1 Hypothetical protein TES1_1430 [Thermococcus paralvinellae]